MPDARRWSASARLAASVTVIVRPRMLRRASGFSLEMRVGEPPTSTAPSSSTRVCRLSRTTNPSGRRAVTGRPRRGAPRQGRPGAAPATRHPRPSMRPERRRDHASEKIAARSRSPSPAVAPRGSPSTPFGVTRRMPPSRSSGMSSPIGATLPCSRRSERTRAASRAIRIDVSVRPAWASRRSSSPSRAASGRHGSQAARRSSSMSTGTAAASASMLPPWPFTNTTRSAHSLAERPYSMRRSVSAGVPIEIVPGKSWCSPLAPYAIAGATTASTSTAANRAASASQTTDATVVSVSSGRCGPCCSVDPSGTSTTGRAHLGPRSVGEARAAAPGHDATSEVAERHLVGGARLRRFRPDAPGRGPRLARRRLSSACTAAAPAPSSRRNSGGM